MVDVSLHGDDVVFTVQGLHKVLAFKSSITIPRAHIAGARQDTAAARDIRDQGIPRALTTRLPWLLKAGTFYLYGDSGLKPTFVDVAHPDHAVIIDLHDEDYHQLIIEVEDPAAVVALLGPTPTAA